MTRYGLEFKHAQLVKHLITVMNDYGLEMKTVDQIQAAFVSVLESIDGIEILHPLQTVNNLISIKNTNEDNFSMWHYMMLDESGKTNLNDVREKIRKKLNYILTN